MSDNVLWSGEGGLIQDWFALDEPLPGVFRIQEPFHEENVKSFLVVGSERAALIDTGMGVADIQSVVESITSHPVIVVNSHAHWDHIGGNAEFDEIWIHEAEADGLVNGVPNEVLAPWFAPELLRGPLPHGVTPESIKYPPTPATGTLEGGEEIELGDRTFEVIHCPGHSPGGIALWDEHNRVLFTTDVAYPCTLYVDNEDDLADYLNSVERLVSLDPAPMAVYGSHCDVEMPVAMLAAQRDAIAAVVDGLQADENLLIQGRRRLHWQFDGFALVLG